MKDKIFSAWAKAEDSNGVQHYVTIVGKLSQRKKRKAVSEDTLVEYGRNSLTEAVLLYDIKELERTLTIGMSICHPDDEFNEKEGIKVALRKINNGNFIGQLTTSDVTMLTKDAVMAEIIVKLDHVSKNIDKYLP